MKTRPLEYFKRFVHQRCNELLFNYIQYIRNSYVPASGKEINDAIWGTIALSPIEVLLIDSPLLQRLRYVRQIGVSHWVYPSAGHTRFEHTLGVLHQTRELIASLNHFAITSAGGVEIINPNDAQLLRIAAIMHDVGHGAFSHVSENALMNFDFYKEVVADFAECVDGEPNKLSEIFAYYAVESPSFKDLLRAISDKVKTFPKLAASPDDNIEQCCKKIQNAIVGLLIDNDIPQLHELINGPFDADKLDYLTRDSKQSGVPTVVDISRLSQKLAVHQVTLTDVPRRIGERINPKGNGCYLIGIRSSGAAVLDELHLARAMLFNKIYRHQKIKAIESMVESLFRVVAQAIGIEHLLKFAYCLNDDEILSLNEATIQTGFSSRGIRLKQNGRKRIPVAVDLIGRIRSRELFVRAFAIQPRYPSDPRGEKRSQSLGLQALVTDLSSSKKVGELKSRIVEELATILESIEPTILARYGKENLPYFISIIPPNQPPGGTEIDRALLFPVGERPTMYGESNFATGNWSRFYATTDGGAGYVFCPRDLCRFVHVACEVVLNQQYEIIVPDSALQLVKHHPDDIWLVKRRLAGKRYFSGKSYYLRPFPSRLKRGDIPGRLQAIADKFAEFQMPELKESDAHLGLSREERIEVWLRQFEEDDLIECALTVLEQFKFLSRAEIVRRLRGFFITNPSYRGSILSGLGTLKDSSSIIGYYANDLGSDYVKKTLHIQEAVNSTSERPIVFCDDFIGSGGQATDILGNWFDKEELKKNLNEERLPLFDQQKNLLRERKVAFLFVAGWRQGVAELEDAIRKLELNAVVYCGLPEDELPFAFGNVALHKDPEVVQKFREKCAEVGRAVLSTKGMDTQRVEERCLGYGNRAMLVATPYNVPTQTLTCIWCEGVYDGVPWQPILLRRRKT